MGLRFIGNGVFVDRDPVDVSEALGPKDWVPGNLKDYKFYPYVEFMSLERASYGIVMANRVPRSPKEASLSLAIDRQMVWNDPIAPLNDFGDVLQEFSRGIHHWTFEEFPYTEIRSKEDYVKLLKASGAPVGPKDWVPGMAKKAPDMSDWKGPGVYDVRVDPPTRAYRSVEAYEMGAMEHEAGETLDFMFQGDEWKDLVKKLAEEYAR